MEDTSGILDTILSEDLNTSEKISILSIKLPGGKMHACEEFLSVFISFHFSEFHVPLLLCYQHLSSDYRVRTLERILEKNRVGQSLLPYVKSIHDDTDLPADIRLQTTIGYIIHTSLEMNRDPILPMIIHQSCAKWKFFLRNFYPGIVFFCVQNPSENACILWETWIPHEPDQSAISGSLIAFSQVVKSGKMTNSLAQKLAASIGYSKNSEILHFLSQQITPVARLVGILDSQYKLTLDIQSLVLMEDKVDISRGKDFDDIFSSYIGISWAEFRETLTADCPFSNALKDVIPNAVFTATHRQCLTDTQALFLSLIEFYETGKISRNFFIKNNKIFVTALVHKNAFISQIARTVWDTIDPGILASTKEIVFDTIIQIIREKEQEMHGMSILVRELVLAGLDPAVTIDLVREIFSIYSPRSCPIWCMHLMLVISGSLGTDGGRNVSEDYLMSPSQLMALEMIDRLKFFLDISTHEGVVDPDEIANICFVKSVLAIRTIRNCLRVFKNFQQIFIIKLNEVWNFLKFFLPLQIKEKEDELRLLFSLELLMDITTDDHVIEFFANRLKADIWPLLDATYITKANDQDHIRQELARNVKQFIIALGGEHAPEIH